MCQRRDTAFGPTCLSSQAVRPDDTPQHTAGVAMVNPSRPSALQVSPDRSSSLSSPAATMWNTDTGASAHMTPHRHWFRSYSPHSIPIRLANSHIVYSAGLGSVVFQPAEMDGVLPPAIVLHDVLHVPDRKSTRLNSSHSGESRMPSSA